MGFEEQGSHWDLSEELRVAILQLDSLTDQCNAAKLDLEAASLAIVDEATATAFISGVRKQSRQIGSLKEQLVAACQLRGQTEAME